jgi:uncharacterized protein YjiS (DUF1127 family)
LSNAAEGRHPKEEEMTAIAQTTTSSFFEVAFAAFVAQVRAHRARRTQRIALRTLLEMDPSRLDDFGITAFDVMEALDRDPPATRDLEAKRARHAAEWTGGAAKAA